MLGLLMLMQLPADIVVTAQKLVEAQAECARGACPPLRDAQTTIALAEVRFRDGNYMEAKRLLAAGAARNKDKEAQEPRGIAALYEAYATVALHEGDRQDYRRAVADQVRVLNAHLPPDDPAVLTATTSLGDMWIELGNYPQAEQTYRAIERRALAQGRDRAAMLAGMKLAWIAAARRQDASPYRIIDELERRPVAREAGFATALKVLRLRIAARDAKGDEVTRLIGALGSAGGPEPVLLVSPPYRLDAEGEADRANRGFDARSARVTAASDIAGVRWADVGFWVRPDGTTAEIEILRGSYGEGWMKPALEQIVRRRYSRSGDGGEGGVYRVERFTAASEYQTPKGSLISRRAPRGGYEVLDLTQAPAAPPPEG